MNMRLRGQVVIAFRSNLLCFWEIWSVVSSIPRSGRCIFFFVQINYYKLFLYALILYNDKKQSKVLSNLSKITLNFWTVCNDFNLKYICMYFVTSHFGKMNLWHFFEHICHHFLVGLLLHLLHPPKSDDKYPQLTRGAFMKYDFLRNPHFNMK